MSRLFVSLSIVLAVSSSACCRKGEEKSSRGGSSLPTTTSTPTSASFSYDPNLPPACRANVSFLVTCAERKYGAEREDLMGRARTMQKAQMEDVAKSGAAKANGTCASLASIVRMNKACQ